MTTLLSNDKAIPRVDEPNAAIAPFAWEYSGPILSDPIWQRWFVFFVAATLGLVGIASLFGLYLSGPDAAFSVLSDVAVVMMGFGLFIGGTAVLVNGNRWRAAYSLDEHGVRMLAGTQRQRDLAGRINDAGALLGNAQVVVAAQAAEDNSRQTVAWRDVYGVSVDRRHRIVTLWNSWRPMLYLWCPPAAFATVVARTEAGVVEGARRRVFHPGESPAACWSRRSGNTLWTFGAVAAALACLWRNDLGEEFAILSMTLACFVFIAGVFPGWTGRGLALLTSIGSLFLFAAVLGSEGEWNDQAVCLAGFLTLFILSVYRLLRQLPTFVSAPDSQVDVTQFGEPVP